MSTARSAVEWPIEQAQGWWEQATKTVSDLTWEDFLPPAMLSTAAWLKEQLYYALGGGTPQEQMSSSMALGIAAIVSTALTLGATVGAVVFFAVTFMVGAFRLWPFADSVWPFGDAE